MLYLLHPRRPMKVCHWETIHGPVHPLFRLVALPWQPTAEGVDSVLVRLALRHGTTCLEGLVIHHEFVAMRNNATRWGRVCDLAQLPVPAPPPSLGREFAAAVRRFDVQMNRSEQAMRQVVQRRLDRALTPPPVPALVRHWVQLGEQPDEQPDMQLEGRADGQLDGSSDGQSGGRPDGRSDGQLFADG